jgi:[acyl-carrier-protein] S-malonyltransferase
MAVALLFPGQGSQVVGMDRAADGSPLDPATFEEVDDALGEPLSRSIAEGPDDVLARTENTQPALLAAGVATWRWLQRRMPDLPVVAAAGHSLGEYTALVASGALGLSDAARLVRLRGRAMQSAVPQGTGSMAAVVGLDDDAVRELCTRAARGEVLEVAAWNCPGQVSVAGHAAAVARLVEAVEAAGGVARLLAVSAPFHCSLLAPAAAPLREALAQVHLQPGVFPVVHNVDAAVALDADGIRARLVEQVVAPVRWSACVATLRTLGVEAAWECGPGRTLAGLVRRVDRGMTVRAGREA